MSEDKIISEVQELLSAARPEMPADWQQEARLAVTTAPGYGKSKEGMMINKRILALGVMLLALAAGIFFLIPSSHNQAVAAPALTAPGSLEVIVKPGEKLLTCPLEHTDVEGWITGDIARVRVTQRFSNPYDHPIEAVYVFPLPENSAVNDMLMQIGPRTIRGLIKKREEAKQIYETAKAAGKTASLLEQERPNIFTQSVANIMPGNKIEITIWYLQDLQYDNGRYDFTFPMVVGPRYIPGVPLGGPDTGGGWAPDTTQVPDASRITPPVLKPAERTGHDISLALHLDAGVPAYDARSKSHQIVVESKRSIPSLIKLAPNDMLPNKDFNLSWRVAGEKPEVGLLTYSSPESGYFTLILQPKADFTAEEITPKEMVFCLDTSGSMEGFPIEKSKEVVKRCLNEMGPNDTFQVIRFSGDEATFAPASVPATQANIAKAIAFINNMEGSGGTEMLKGIEASLAAPPDENRLRIVAFLTDGYVGNEAEILQRVQQKLGAARIFSFGIGSSVNRYLLTKLAQMGRGVAQFVRADENPDNAVQNFVARISRPYLTDIQIDWGGLDVEDIYPAYVPDLFADQPVILHGRYNQPGSGKITIHGNIAGQPWETSIAAEFPARAPDDEAVATLWARARIEDLTDQQFGGEKPEIVADITQTALAYRLMSPYTSFVAVEEKVVNKGGQQVTVQQPIPIPDAVSYEGNFGAASEMGESYAGRVPAKPPAMPKYKGTRIIGQIPTRMGFTTNTLKFETMDWETASSHYAPLEESWFAVVAADDYEETSQAQVNLERAAQTVIALPSSPAVTVMPDRLSALPNAKSLSVVILSGSKPLNLTEKSRQVIAQYLRDGGFLIISSGSNEFYRSVVDALRSSLQGERLTKLRPGHALYQSGAMPYKLTGSGISGAEGLMWKGRLAAVIISHDFIKSCSKPMAKDNAVDYQLGVNLIAYALQNAPEKKK
jgi:Ca-activated chloride channel homolog